MGSTPHAHAMAKVKTPHEQGVVAMIGVFIDTFLVLTMTALVVISTLYAGNGPLAGGAAEGIDQSNMAQLAFSSVFGEGLGSIFVAVCLLFFAFSTILSWNFFGEPLPSTRCLGWCSSSWARVCPMTWCGPCPTCLISSWSFPTPWLCWLCPPWW